MPTLLDGFIVCIPPLPYSVLNDHHPVVTCSSVTTTSPAFEVYYACDFSQDRATWTGGTSQHLRCVC